MGATQVSEDPVGDGSMTSRRLLEMPAKISAITEMEGCVVSAK
jgi:hypothetical protein